MTDTPKLNLRQKMIQIYNEIDHVGKYGENTKQHYNFVRAADVMRPVREAFAKWGVYAETNYELLGTYDIKTNNGGTMHTATVKATIVLHDADSDETMTISGLGDGADSGDKGIFKAQTGATKNALRNGTLLPDEADPEADQNVDDSTTGPYFPPQTPNPPADRSVPDFQEAQHAAPRGAAAPKSEKTSGTAISSPKAPSEAPTTTATAKTGPSQPVPSTETPQSYGAAPVDAPSPKTANVQDAPVEHGDAYEGPDDNGALPTEAEMADFRARFVTLSKNLSAKQALSAGKGLKLNDKLRNFLVQVVGAPDINKVTKSQWDGFFARVDAALANPEVGYIGLGKLVNKANGIEPKQ